MTLARRLARLSTILVGAGTLLFAVAVAVAPAQVLAAVPPLEPVVEATRDLDGSLVLVVASGVVGLLASRLARSGTSPDETVDPEMDAESARLPESVAVDPGTVTGDALQRAYDSVESPTDLESVADGLRETAVAVERAVTGADAATASQRVAAGEWTDDDLAAAVLGGDVPLPVTARLRGWLDPEGEAKRRLARVIDAVESRLDGGETDG